MSGSTVLKNSAQLCSYRHKTKKIWLERKQRNHIKLCMHFTALSVHVYTCSNFVSCVKHSIWEPTMLAQDCRVKTVRMKGSVSPWRCTIDAIWITGSLSGSGKIPGSKEATPESFDFHQVRPALVMRLNNVLTVILTRSKNSREFLCKQSTFSSCALYVKAEDSEWCNPLPLSLCRVTYQILPSHIHLILTQGGLEEKNKSGKVHKHHLPIQIH